MEKDTTKNMQQDATKIDAMQENTTQRCNKKDAMKKDATKIYAM